jgi:hypothetical protein
MATVNGDPHLCLYCDSPAKNQKSFSYGAISTVGTNKKWICDYCLAAADRTTDVREDLKKLLKREQQETCVCTLCVIS